MFSTWSSSETNVILDVIDQVSVNKQKCYRTLGYGRVCNQSNTKLITGCLHPIFLWVPVYQAVIYLIRSEWNSTLLESLVCVSEAFFCSQLWKLKNERAFSTKNIVTSTEYQVMIWLWLDNNRCSLRLRQLSQDLAHKHLQGHQGNLHHVRKAFSEDAAL
jgi:hypothetical protein